MNDFKVTNFDAEHPGVPFPAREATAAEIAAIRAALAKRLGLHPGATGEQLAAMMRGQSKVLGGIDATSPDFSLGHVLERARAGERAGDLFLNWYHLEQLDVISADDLVTYFDDIWYPSSDDLDIIPVDAGWVVLVEHHGGVRVIEAARP